MAIVVVGGHSRSVGKTSVVVNLIARLPQFNWTACKITQFGHGFCTANGEPCDCQTDEHTIAISAERDPTTGTDSARFLELGQGGRSGCARESVVWPRQCLVFVRRLTQPRTSSSSPTACCNSSAS